MRAALDMASMPVLENRISARLFAMHVVCIMTSEFILMLSATRT